MNGHHITIFSVPTTSTPMYNQKKCNKYFLKFCLFSQNYETMKVNTHLKQFFAAYFSVLIYKNRSSFKVYS